VFQADGLKAYCRIGIPGEHRGIVNDPHIFRMLHHFLRVGEYDPDYEPAIDAVLVPSAEEIEREIARAKAAAAQKAHLAELEKKVVASIERGDFEEGKGGDLVVHFQRKLDEARKRQEAPGGSGSLRSGGETVPGVSAVRHPPTVEERLAAKALRVKEEEEAAKREAQKKTAVANAYVEVDDLFVSAHATSSPCGSPDVRCGCCCGPSLKSCGPSLETTVSVKGGEGDYRKGKAIEVATRAAADGAVVKAAGEEAELKG
jgi:hypothetical protein